MLRMSASGSTAKMDRFLANAVKSNNTIESRVRSVAEAGVQALAQATPEATGVTAASWDYQIVSKNGEIDIYWTNSHQNEGQQIAVLIQYGHGTGTGGYVQGRDYINPAIRPIFDQIADSAWKAVNSG